MPFSATWMDLRDYHTKSERERQIIIYHAYVESKKIETNELIYKQKQTLRHRKKNL